MAIPPDTLTRFSFADSPVRGAVVRLESAWQTLAARDNYPTPVRQMLGECVAAGALFTSHIKLEGSLSLQIQGGAALSLLHAQCTSQGSVRGIARYEENAIAANFTMANLKDDATLAITIDQKGSQRYQGVVPLLGSRLQEAFEAYFVQSEQIDTRIWLSADENHAAGLMLQRMPGNPDAGDYWEHVVHLASTISETELLMLDSEELLFRLFHLEQVNVLESGSLRFECPCSRQRVARVLTALGRDETLASIAETGKVEVQCEFCNENYAFDLVDIEALFATLPVVQAGSTRQ